MLFRSENTGAAFWPTCDAMRSLGGMEQFVANGWAGKDYTHINYAEARGNYQDIRIAGRIMSVSYTHL